MRRCPREAANAIQSSARSIVTITFWAGQTQPGCHKWFPEPPQKTATEARRHISAEPGVKQVVFLKVKLTALLLPKRGFSSIARFRDAPPCLWLGSKMLDTHLFPGKVTHETGRLWFVLSAWRSPLLWANESPGESLLNFCMFTQIEKKLKSRIFDDKVRSRSTSAMADLNHNCASHCYCSCKNTLRLTVHMFRTSWSLGKLRPQTGKIIKCSPVLLIKFEC